MKEENERLSMEYEKIKKKLDEVNLELNDIKAHNFNQRIAVASSSLDIKVNIFLV